MEVTLKENILYGNFAVIANGGLLLTYSIPSNIPVLEKGMLCFLPLKSSKAHKTVVGVFLNYCAQPTFQCVNMIDVFFSVKFSTRHLSLFEWVSEYYLAPIEQTLQLLAPSFIWNTSKHVFLEKRQLFLEKDSHKKIKGELSFCENSTLLRELTFEQNRVYENILSSLYKTTLLYGVTGAGKTEVYLKLSQKIISQGKKVLVLVPEIALTPQMSSRFRAVFKEKLAVLHSGLNQSNYVHEWLKIYNNIPDIVLGVRTAVFCPLQNIGLIIVDEEHDGSYKCVESPCYNARDVAIVRAKKEQALCVLGSATPSLESYYNSQRKDEVNKYNYQTLTEKYSKNKVTTAVIDAKEELSLRKDHLKIKFLKSSLLEFENTGLCSHILEQLKQNKEQQQQSMILINRRGYVNYALCANCGTPLSCPNCSISTTLHQKGRKELCHYCGFSAATRTNCPKCGEHSFLFKGIGTQNIEEKLQELLPNLRIDRLDRDVFTSNTRLTQIIDNFRTGKTDCLIGTQLLAKGHDFPKVTLVVLLHVEDSLFIPDFRAAERTFQLITQSMGRAGRGELAGKVLLQSLVLNHPVVTLALEDNIYGFYDREIPMRELAWLPPFCRQILFEVKHANYARAKQIADNLYNLLVELWKSKNLKNQEIRIAGPYQATIEKVKTEYRVQICVHSCRAIHPKNIVPTDLWNNKEFLRFLKIDVDPFSFL